jgi:hypothetical protein
MTELVLTLRKLLGGRGPSASSLSHELDREREASMADEGGSAAAEVEAQPALARPIHDKPEGA